MAVIEVSGCVLERTSASGLGLREISELGSPSQTQKQNHERAPFQWDFSMTLGGWPAGWDEGEMGGFNPKVVLALSLKACPQFCTSFISP